MTAKELREIANSLMDLDGNGTAAALYVGFAEICERLDKIITLIEDDWDDSASPGDLYD